MRARGYIGALPFAEYVALPGKNFSTLKAALVSPAHYQAAVTAPRRDTPAFAFGRACHTAILEPDRIALDLAVLPDGIDRRTKAGKEAHAGFLAANPGRTILDADDYATVLAMRDAAWGHSGARELLTEAATEQVAQWVDAETGLACKLRADAISGDRLVDVKTIESLSRLRWHVREYRYLMQAAFYGDGLRACDIAIREHFIIAIEKNPPYDVGVFRVGENEIAQGREQYRDALDTVAECEGAGQWPGAYPGVTEIAAVLYPDEWTISEVTSGAL